MAEVKDLEREEGVWGGGGAVGLGLGGESEEMKMTGSARGLVSCWMAHVRAASPASMSASRRCSVKPWFDGSVTDSSADAAGEQVGGSSSSNRLEQVLHEFRIQKATPDWLPLMPERSFWMPPEEPVVEEAPAAALEPATEGELFSMIMPSGWPAPAPVGGEAPFALQSCCKWFVSRIAGLCNDFLALFYGVFMIHNLYENLGDCVKTMHVNVV